MTLSTDVYVLDAVDPHEVFAECQRLLSLYDEEHRMPIEHKFEDKQDGSWQAGGERIVDASNPWTIANEPMQNLPAWLFVHYRPGAALRTPEQATEHDDDICTVQGCDWWIDGESVECTGDGHRPACWLNVDFDTAYGYDHNGMGAGDLHALLVAELGKWLDARGVRWSWKNEYTGEVHDSPEKLIELVSGGFEASAWFRTSVLPVIVASAGRRAAQ
jgi:hypothetical protein